MTHCEAQKHWDQDAEKESLCTVPMGSPVMHEGVKSPADIWSNAYARIQQMTCNSTSLNEHMQASCLDWLQHLDMEVP